MWLTPHQKQAVEVTEYVIKRLQIPEANAILMRRAAQMDSVRVFTCYLALLRIWDVRLRDV